MMDKVVLEILRNRFQAIADEMAMVAYRTAHTVFVKEARLRHHAGLQARRSVRLAATLWRADHAGDADG